LHSFSYRIWFSRLLNDKMRIVREVKFLLIQNCCNGWERLPGRNLLRIQHAIHLATNNASFFMHGIFQVGCCLKRISTSFSFLFLRITQSLTSLVKYNKYGIVIIIAYQIVPHHTVSLRIKSFSKSGRSLFLKSKNR
jgi:hypothetical protein